jgi:hypothetical protein
VLRAAGWQVVIARRDDPVAQTLQNALSPRSSAALTGAR